MNKKGFSLSFEMLWWIPKLFYLILVAFTTAVIIMAFIVTNVDVTSAEAQIIMNRILYSPDGINYYDSYVERSYPGVVDLDRFKDAQLSGSLIYPGKPISIKAKLYYNGVINEIYYNKDKYDDWLPLAEAGIKGYGGARLHTVSQYVLVKDGSRFLPGRIELKVITPNA